MSIYNASHVSQILGNNCIFTDLMDLVSHHFSPRQVLDNAERLRNMEGHILPVFLRLSELSDCNVCVILLTQIIWEKFNATSGYLDPVKINFPDYSKSKLKQLVKITTSK